MVVAGHPQLSLAYRWISPTPPSLPLSSCGCFPSVCIYFCISSPLCIRTPIRDFPSGLVVKTLGFQYARHEFNLHAMVWGKKRTLATWCKEATHWERPWCWERVKTGREGDDRRWDGWMASLTQWTWVWASSGSWWWTGKSGMLQSMGLQRVGHDWVTELNWKCSLIYFLTNY